MVKTKNQLNNEQAVTFLQNLGTKMNALPSVVVEKAPIRMTQSIAVDFNPVKVKEINNPRVIAAFFEGLNNKSTTKQMIPRYNTVQHASAKA
jgi:hypothetical protein